MEIGNQSGLWGKKQTVLLVFGSIALHLKSVQYIIQTIILNLWSCSYFLTVHIFQMITFFNWLSFHCFAFPLLSFTREDVQHVISTGMVFPSTTMKILCQDKSTSSQVFKYVYFSNLHSTDN